MTADEKMLVAAAMNDDPTLLPSPTVQWPLRRILLNVLHKTWVLRIDPPMRVISWLIYHGADLSGGRVAMTAEVRTLVSNRQIRFLDVEEEIDG